MLPAQELADAMVNATCHALAPRTERLDLGNMPLLLPIQRQLLQLHATLLDLWPIETFRGIGSSLVSSAAPALQCTEAIGALINQAAFYETYPM